MATVHIGRMAGGFGFSSAVAVKRMYPQMARDPEFVAMFLDEARLASRVRHPNVVAVLDVLAEDGELCLVMEYVDGESLAQLMKHARRSLMPVPVPIAVSIISSILQGLHAAHQATDEQGAPLGLVHRDVSPQNVLVGVDGVARLIDFGVAKAAGRSSVSRVGQLKGKIAYMAPEQLHLGVVTLRSDIYGAAVLSWELFAGRRLFEGGTQDVILSQVSDDPLAPPSQFRADLSAELDRLVLRGLDCDPARRFDSARSMARELEALVRPATAAEVGEWVESLAHDTLVARREKLRRMERETE
jgi:serine/threonine-protein kinase